MAEPLPWLNPTSGCGPPSNSYTINPIAPLFQLQTEALERYLWMVCRTLPIQLQAPSTQTDPLAPPLALPQLKSIIGSAHGRHWP